MDKKNLDESIVSKIITIFSESIMLYDVITTLTTFVLGIICLPLIFHANIIIKGFVLGLPLKESVILYSLHFLVIQLISFKHRQLVMRKYFFSNWIKAYLASSITGMIYFFLITAQTSLVIFYNSVNPNHGLKVQLIINAGWTMGQYFFCLISFYWVSCWIWHRYFINKCN